MTHIQLCAFIIECVCCASVRGNERCCRETEGHEPVRILLFKVKRGCPDRALVPENVLQELSFKRWCRRRLWRICRRLPQRSGDAGQEDNYKYREVPYVTGSHSQIYFHLLHPLVFHNLRSQ